MIKNDDASGAGLAVPAWLLAKDDSGYGGRAGSMGFIRKTAGEFARTLKNELLAERFALRKGLLQGIDARVKLLSMLVFMLYTGLTGRLSTLLLLAVFGILLAAFSKLHVADFIKRVWLVLSLAVFLLSLPAALNIFIPGKPLLYLYRDGGSRILPIGLPEEIYISVQGIQAAVKMAVRAGTSFSFASLLIMTTRWTQLTRGLGRLGIPGMFVSILDMTYRYIFVLVSVSNEIFDARFLRTVGVISGKENRSFISGSMALLFAKANHMSEEIYDAMLCRLYAGKPVSLGETRLSRNDFVWVVNMIVILIVLQLL